VDQASLRCTCIWHRTWSFSLFLKFIFLTQKYWPLDSALGQGEIQSVGWFGSTRVGSVWPRQSNRSEPMASIFLFTPHLQKYFLMFLFYFIFD
jgi:hypothetical protein